MSLSEIDMNRLLAGAFSGSESDREHLIEVVYDMLHGMAARAMARERGVTLQPTVLLNEVYLRLFHENLSPPADRRHFFALASRVIRNILVDHARAKRAQRRGGHLIRVSLADAELDPRGNLDVLEINEAMERLARLEPSWHQMLEYRYFGGLTVVEIADVMGKGKSTVDKQIGLARAWLRRHLEEEHPDG